MSTQYGNTEIEEQLMIKSLKRYFRKEFKYFKNICREHITLEDVINDKNLSEKIAFVHRLHEFLTVDTYFSLDIIYKLYKSAMLNEVDCKIYGTSFYDYLYCEFKRYECEYDFSFNIWGSIIEFLTLITKDA